ncbi:MAG: hypothetical protein HFI64_10125 [Lachnospiraceae bacterium]|nr:hypothetical protein [Lachnospiraceae bacterium]
MVKFQGLLGEKYDTIKYYMRKMRPSGVIVKESTSRNGRWVLKGEKNDEIEL